jgi:hypothetical protein
VSGTEWGIRLHHKKYGKGREEYHGSQEEATAEYDELYRDLNPDRWEITLGYRTMAAEPGPFTEYRPAQEPRAVDDGEVTPEVLADIISLANGVMIPPEVVATWTPAERELALKWASAEHLHASDHHAVRRVPEPGFVTRAEELTSSPALAQLAVEAWVRAKEELEHGWAGESLVDVRAAQDAITGLLVLLRNRQPS